MLTHVYLLAATIVYATALGGIAVRIERRLTRLETLMERMLNERRRA